MSLKVAINGFGRIGRVVTREIFRRGLESKIQIVAINDLTDAQTLAHLLKYDSLHKRFPGEVRATDNSLEITSSSGVKQELKISAIKDPSQLPWKALGVDIVLECTGIFTKKDKAALHIASGCKKVIISAPSPDPDITIAFGVNSKDYDANRHNIISCGSCTTNCLAPLARVLVDSFGIVRSTMTTIHSYTNDQNILDLPHKDLRRARAAALSMIPTTTGAAKAIGLVVPEMVGKCDGFAVRVPTPDVSLVDFVAEVGRDTTVEEVNNALRSASQGALKGVLDYCDEPLVSMDHLGSSFSSIVDSQLTMVIGKRLVKVVSWYDNEVGFSSRMVDLIQHI